MSLFATFWLLLLAVSATFTAGACSPHDGCRDFGGNLTLPLVLDSHMVLQRAPKQAALWGWCSPTQAVTVQLDQQPAVRATADGTGFWKVTLAPQSAGVGHVIVITCADGARAMLADVAFGDVMVCSGQSHMTFSVNQDLNGTEAIGQSAKYPGIRMLTVGDASANSPLEDVAKLAYDRARLPANSSWLPSAPSSFGTGLFSYPSAICYYYARELYVHFNGSVPMGVISSSVGGSPIEQWTRPEVQAAEYYPSNKSATCAGSRDTLTNICGGAQAAAFEHAPVPTTAQVGWGPPGSLFNAMIYGLRHMTLRSVLWDQGEANNNDDCLYYGCKLATLAHDWRHNIFQDPSLLFTFDQFRAERFAGGADMPSFTSVIPHSTYATRLDLQTCYPNHTSAGHAVRKLEVGRRLAHAARVVEYGEAAGPLTFGPHIVGAAVAPTTVPGLYNLTVQLQNAAGLHFHDAPECPGCCEGRRDVPLVQGTPATGDAWSLSFADGTVATVCKDTAISAACDGHARIVHEVAGDAGSAALNVLVVARSGAPAASDAQSVLYGGTGPWLDQRPEEPVVPLPKVTYAGQCIELFNDTDINPHTAGLGNIPADSASTCCTACASAEWAARGCQYFTLSLGQCWFKATADIKVSAAGKVSGRVKVAPTPAPVPTPAPQVKCVYPHSLRFGVEACYLLNGQGGFDDHQGVAMAAQVYKLT